MESRILINYKRAAEAAFRNIQTANMFNPVQQPEIGKDGRDPLPYVTAFLRAEDDLLEHIKLEPLNESEKEFLLSFINSTKKVESTGYCQFAADEIWEGLQEMKSRLTNTAVKEPSRREVLTNAVREAGGGLSVNKIHGLAREHGYNEKGMENLYYRIKDDLM